MHKIILALALLLAPVAAYGQSVQQSGSVTAGHAPYWVTNGVIADGGTASDSPISSFGVTNSGGPGICVSSGRSSAAGRQQLCLSASLNGGGQITLQNYGTATAQPLQFVINGSTVTLPTGGGTTIPTITTPLLSGNIICASGTGGALVGCTAGTSGQVFLGSTGLAPGFATMSGDATILPSGAITVARINGVTYGTSPATNTVPVVTSANTVTYETLPFAAMPSIANNTVLGNVTGISAVPGALTATQLTTLCNAFSSVLSGCAPSSGGGGANLLRADGSWAAAVTGGFTVAPASGFIFLAQGSIVSPADGVFELLNNAGTGFTRLQLGGTTASFPAIKRNSTAINLRLADDSGDAPLTAGATTITGSLAAPATTITGSFTATGLVGLGNLATQATNTALVNATSGSASPTAQSMPSCSAGNTALTWTTNTGFGCGTITTAATSVAVGTTTVTSGVAGSLLYNNGGVLGNTANSLAQIVYFNFNAITSGSYPPNLSNGFNVRIISPDGINGGVQINAFAQAPLITTGFSRGTGASPTAVGNGDSLAILNFSGYDGTNYGGTSSHDAYITVSATQAFTTSAHGTSIAFGVTANGATSAQAALTLNQDKSATFGAGVTATAYTAGASAGLSTTKTVRASGGAADCTLIYTGGLLTGGSC